MAALVIDRAAEPDVREAVGDGGPGDVVRQVGISGAEGAVAEGVAVGDLVLCMGMSGCSGLR